MNWKKNTESTSDDRMILMHALTRVYGSLTREKQCIKDDSFNHVEDPISKNLPTIKIKPVTTKKQQGKLSVNVDSVFLSL